MTNIIKRRKTAHYTQINNFPVQEDLRDLAAVGLLTYIMSLPADWTLYKTHLQKAFTRRKVDSAWKVLVEKKYAIGFYAHVNGHKNWFYLVSDIAFTQKDYDEFVVESIEEVLEEKEATIYNVTPILDSPFEIPNVQNVHQGNKEPKTPDVQNVQFREYSSDSTSTKEIHTKETRTNTQPFTIVNEGADLVNLANELYPEFAPGRWSKESWNVLIAQFAAETLEMNRHENMSFDKLRGYIYKSIENMARHHDFKTGKRKMGDAIKTKKPHFYNWLDERE